MAEFKFCIACLLTDVKMYSLDTTSNKSMGLTYSQLTQISICDRNQHVCYECASLLQKFQIFKAKCLRAHTVLFNVVGNSSQITKEVIQDIDRKENQLESHNKLSKTEINSINCSNEYDNVCQEFEILKEDEEMLHVDIKPEIEEKKYITARNKHK